MKLHSGELGEMVIRVLIEGAEKLMEVCLW